MKQSYNILLLLLMLPALVVANNGKKGKYKKTKNLSKEYTVNSDAALKVNNSYGNVDVITWTENRTVIDVEIITSGDDEESVIEKLSSINVEFTATSSKVIAKTIFKDSNKSSWSLWGNNKNVNMEVNYTIKIPINNSVDINNDYGNISINELNGNARINCDYGQLNLGKLNADDNYITFDYSKNSNIEYMKSGKINADYSGFTLEKVGRLELNADYTKSEVLNVVDLNYNCDYGRLSIGQVKDIIGKGSYIPLRVEEVQGNLNVNSDYGSISVTRLTSSAGDITIRSDYAGIKLGYEDGYHFDFTVDLSYAGLSGKEDLDVMKTSKDYTSKFYSGYRGTKNTGNVININSDYGSVTLRKL